MSNGDKFISHKNAALLSSRSVVPNVWHKWTKKDLWDRHETTTVLGDIKVTVQLQKQALVPCEHGA